MNHQLNLFYNDYEVLKSKEEYPFLNKSQWSILTEQELDNYALDVLNYYRDTGFPYFPVSKEWRDKEFNKLLAYKDDVFDGQTFCQTMHGLSLAWSYFPHSWNIKCNNLKTCMEVFNDDIMFLKVIKKRIKYGDNISNNGIRKALKIFTGTQCVSNFRPTTARSIYNHFSNNGNIWDMSAGFGGRLLGFITSNAKSYIGTDPSTLTYNGLCELKNDYGTKHIELYKLGSEDYIPDKNSLDLCFTSPPYFNCEKYSNESTQSFIKYNTKEKWINEFLYKTFSNCYYGLKEDRYMIINIENVKSFNNLVDETIRVAKEVGFTYEQCLYYALSSLSKKDSFKKESVLVFKK